MRLTHRRHGLFLFFMLAFTLVGFRAPAAQAASEKGAYIIDDYNCLDYYMDRIECFGTKGVVNEAITPSGNTSYIGNVVFTYTILEADGTILYHETYRRHEHTLTMDDLLQEWSNSARFRDGVCTSNYTFHEANGQIQFERDEYSCSVE